MANVNFVVGLLSALYRTMTAIDVVFLAKQWTRLCIEVP